ncbi:MAG: hypothetical protein FWD15_01630 [Alphaproteobacteria bacterium]|nr:hypothetical protein [Alphaproteobacteria bacterium]
MTEHTTAAIAKTKTTDYARLLASGRLDAELLEIQRHFIDNENELRLLRARKLDPERRRELIKMANNSLKLEKHDGEELLIATETKEDKNEIEQQTEILNAMQKYLLNTVAGYYGQFISTLVKRHDIRPRDIDDFKNCMLTRLDEILKSYNEERDGLIRNFITFRLGAIAKIYKPMEQHTAERKYTKPQTAR